MFSASHFFIDNLMFLKLDVTFQLNLISTLYANSSIAFPLQLLD
ncbi:hypothetical protein D778_01693 [Xanthomarina gelatinilytica]|uniref:Uncharacterized protein n=1 Tax=Xanthomarina gelatinilytica TaxID=1137281 RepID=M7NBG0_9FLAO|nr:hypothetical protein D778_01693 [Xanthomarina gelatinilytica]